MIETTAIVAIKLPGITPRLHHTIYVRPKPHFSKIALLYKNNRIAQTKLLKNYQNKMQN